jgi:hypothetical protein
MLRRDPTDQGGGANCPGLQNKRVSPHVLRHTCAMIVVLQATQDIRRADIFQWSAGSMSSHWRKVQKKELGLIAPVLDPTSPKDGIVAHIEVRPGDIVRGSERAEVANMRRKDAATGKTIFFPVIGSDGHEFYGLALKLSPDWQSPGKNHGTGPVWGTFLQLHGPVFWELRPPSS